MKEMRVLIESILPLDGEYLSGWFTLPIEAEVSERIGLNSNYEECAVHATENNMIKSGKCLQTIDFTGFAKKYENY